MLLLMLFTRMHTCCLQADMIHQTHQLLNEHQMLAIMLLYKINCTTLLEEPGRDEARQR